MLLSIKNLRVGVKSDDGPVELVRGVNLDIARGEIVGLVGESGSGKSLTALSIPRLLPSGVGILGGDIVLDGTELTRLKDSQLHRLRGREIGFIFQDPLTALNPVLTIGAQLMDVVRAHPNGFDGSVRERVLSSLKSVGIADPEQCIRSYPHQLSGGMRQRSLIAMVLLAEPKIILADEPTTALDVTVQARIVRLLHSIRSRTGVAILFISHNLDLVSEVCDRVIVMYGGRAMEQGSTAQVVNTPRHPYTRALLRCIPRLESATGRLSVIPGQAPSSPGAIAGCPFAERCERQVESCREAYPEATDAGSGHEFHCWNPVSEAVLRHDA